MSLAITVATAADRDIHFAHEPGRLNVKPLDWVGVTTCPRGA
jgi:hypothetical protein